VSRTDSIAAVTAISLHETSSIVRSNSNTTVLSSLSVRSRPKSTWSDRLSMTNFTGAFSDLPSPPYSQPKDYEALVEAMLQGLYRLNPEWVERKQRLQQVWVSGCDADIMSVFVLISRCRSERNARLETRSIPSSGVPRGRREHYLSRHCGHGYDFYLLGLIYHGLGPCCMY
jgi:hypothetical protein